MALQLKKAGIPNVRPLEGGLDSWRQHARTAAGGGSTLSPGDGTTVA